MSRVIDYTQAGCRFISTIHDVDRYGIIYEVCFRQPTGVYMKIFVKNMKEVIMFLRKFEQNPDRLWRRMVFEYPNNRHTDESLIDET